MGEVGEIEVADGIGGTEELTLDKPKAKGKGGKAKAVTSIKPKIVMRGTRMFWTHHFKTNVEPMSKNRSWQYGKTVIDKIEHVHMFHTKNSQGKDMKYTAPVGGHFHEIIVSKSDDGEIVAKCGPALHYKFKKLRSGKVKKTIAQVAWYNEEKDSNLADDHVHKMIYLDSENLSPEKIKQTRENNANGIAEVSGKVEEDFGL